MDALDAMTDDPAEVQRRVAYIDQIRNLHRNKRVAGFVGCLVGVVVMLIAAFVPGAPDWMRWIGLAVILLSWGLFVFVTYSRTQYVRSHPFDPEASA